MTSGKAGKRSLATVFKSFFPNPKYFFLSALLWAFVCGAAWFLFVQDWSVGKQFFQTIGYTQPGVDGRPPFLIPERLYIYTFIILSGVIFATFWTFVSDNKWKLWSVWGSTTIVIGQYFNVQNDVFINDWYGGFYDMLQDALSKKRVVPIEEYYGRIASIAIVLVLVILFIVLLTFLTRHFIFRWRSAMNDYYVQHWPRLRTVEGASQRVQDDTMRFARQLEGLGVSLISSIMTLIAFLPLLWTLSSHITHLPFIPNFDGSLVFVSLISASFGTILLALVGIKLPGLEFRNQRVEAAYRKELVYGEDHEDRAQPPTLAELFAAVRKNYIRMYFNYLYFDVAKYAYLQGAVFVPLFALGPTVVVAGITMGLFQQITDAFRRVDDSLRFFASAWDNIVELLSIYKRLHAFESVLDDGTLPDIDRKFAETGELNG
jgi:peptide/bleomycin uptake transporter